MSSFTKAQEAYIAHLLVSKSIDPKMLDHRGPGFEKLGLSFKRDYQDFKNLWFQFAFPHKKDGTEKHIYRYPGTLQMKAKRLAELLAQYELMDVDQVCCDDAWHLFEKEYVAKQTEQRIARQHKPFRSYSSPVSRNFYKHWQENKE